MLDAMFETLLTDIEVKAIAKTRKFPGGDRPARSAVKNFFLTTTGLAEAFTALTREEITALHMVAQQGEVDVSFFDRLYPIEEDVEPGQLFTLTFTQRYRTALKETRERLVRRGVLLFSIENTLGTARAEQYRFSVPDPFVPLLPPMVETTRREGSQGEMNTERVTRKLSQIVSGEKGSDPLAADSSTRLSLQDGVIFYGKLPFTMPDMVEWQVTCWMRSLNVGVLSEEIMVHPARAIMDALANQGNTDWFNPESLTPVLKVMSFGLAYPPAEKIMEEGWMWGLFARETVGGQTLYAPRWPAFTKKEPLVIDRPLDQMITAEGDGVWCDPTVIAPALLSDLNLTSRFERKRGRLFARPDVERMASVYHLAGESFLLPWLEQHSPAYTRAMARLRERWGKTILHQGMLLARITDLTLRMQIEKTYQPGVDYVALSPEWLALRQGLEGEIEKLTNKAGFVVKRVKAR